MKIVMMANIARKDIIEFHEELKRIINDFQNNGLNVEVQYQITGYSESVSGCLYTALVLGRKNAPISNDLIK